MSAGEMIGKLVGEHLGEAATNLMESMSSSLERTAAGKALKEVWQNKIMPETAAMAEGHIQRGTTPPPSPADYAKARGAAFENITQKYFGKDLKVLPKILLAVQKQSGSLAHTQNVAGHISVLMKDGAEQFRRDPLLKDPSLPGGYLVKAKSDYTAPAEWEGKLRALASYSFTNFLAIPHASQYALNNLMHGAPISVMAKGLAESWGAGRDVFIKDYIASGSLFDEFQFQAAQDAKNQASGKAAKFVKGALHQPGFLKSRREMMIWTGATGKHLALDAAERLKSGDKNQAEVWLRQLGLDPQKIAAQGHKLTQENIDTAMYRWTDEVMFLKSPLATPAGWEKSSLARLSTMYKHWAFREGGVIKNGLMSAYKKEGVKGVAQVAATLGVVFPMVGEFNHSAQLLLSGQDPTQRDPAHGMGVFTERTLKDGTTKGFIPPAVAEYIDALSWAGGLGIGHSMLRAAQWHGLSSWVIGPLASTALSFGDDLINAKYRQLTKDALRLGSWPGKMISHQIPTIAESKKKDLEQKRMMMGKPAHPAPRGSHLHKLHM